MSETRKNIEFEEVAQEKVKARKFSFRSLIDGNILTQDAVIKQAPFLVLIVFISLLVIANRNHAEKLVIRSNELRTEVKELHSRSISTSSQLMMMSRESRVEQMVEERGLGLEENKEPMKKLIKE